MLCIEVAYPQPALEIAVILPCQFVDITQSTSQLNFRQAHNGREERGERGEERGERGEGRGERGEGRGEREEGRGERGEGRGERREGRGERGEERGERREGRGGGIHSL